MGSLYKHHPFILVFPIFIKVLGLGPTLNNLYIQFPILATFLVQSGSSLLYAVRTDERGISVPPVPRLFYRKA